MNFMKPFGLGDLAYYAFRPFAALTDLIWATDMLHCEKCHERRKAWNKAFTRPLYFWVAIAALLVLILSISKSS